MRQSAINTIWRGMSEASSSYALKRQRQYVKEIKPTGVASPGNPQPTLHESWALFQTQFYLEQLARVKG